MDFLDIGPGEILLILIVALIVFGPEKLVDMAKTLGKTMHAFKKSASDLTTQVTREIEEAKAIAETAAREQPKDTPVPHGGQTEPAAGLQTNNEVKPQP